VNNRGGGCATAITSAPTRVALDNINPSLRVDVLASGAPVALNQQNVIIDPRTFATGHNNTRRAVRVEASGNAQTVVGGQYRVDTRELLARRPVDRTIYTDVFMAPNTGTDMCADRFQRVRTYMQEARAEDRSSASELNASGGRSLFDRPITTRGRVFRDTGRGDEDSQFGWQDVGAVRSAVQCEPKVPDTANFYARRQLLQSV